MPMRGEIGTGSSGGTTRPLCPRSGEPWSDFALVSTVSIVGFLAALLLAVLTHQLDPMNIAAVTALGP
jgi:hypothetical protein